MSMSVTLKMKILLNEKSKKNLKIAFCIRFRTLRIFSDQKLNLVTLEEVGGGRGEAGVGDSMSLTRYNTDMENQYRKL